MAPPVLGAARHQFHREGILVHVAVPASHRGRAEPDAAGDRGLLRLSVLRSFSWAAAPDLGRSAPKVLRVAIFTCITEVHESFHLSQHSATVPEAALRDHVAAMPKD